MKKLLLIWLLLPLFLVSFAHAEALAPRQLVAATVDEVLADMRLNAAVYSADATKLQAMVMERVGPHFNFQRMAQLAMARHWPTATKEQKAAVSTEFRTLLARTYANAMFDFRDAEVKVMGEQQSSPRSTMIKLRVESRSGQPVDLLLRLENRNERWQVIDVVVGGVSLIITYRGSFNDRISKGGIDSLISDMRSGNLGVNLQ